MATPNQMTEAENAAHAPIDPFAVDFFGGKKTLVEEDEAFNEAEIEFRPRRAPRKKSDWHKNLPRVTNREAEFSNLLSNLPENLTDRAADFIRQTLGRYLSGPVEKLECVLLSVSETDVSRALREASESSQVLVGIGARAEKTVAVAALNVDLAGALIHSMLDTDAAQQGSLRRLSPVETAICEYLAAQILNETNRFLGEPLLFLRGVGQAQAIEIEPFERGAEMVFGIETGKLSGVFSFYAPGRFLRIFDRAQNPLFRSRRDRKSFRDYQKLAPALDVRLQIGTTHLDADSLLFLEPEDIVLVEQSPAGLISEGFAGASLPILIGRGGNVRLRGKTESGDFNGGLFYRIEEILSEEARRRFTPAKFKMDETENDLEQENVFENEAPADAVEATDDPEITDEQLSPSLENVQVALRVEIAGNKISLRELQNLRAGQIIALGTSPTDPVRLVTDNSDEPVASGELVDIEGQLGVRLTKIFI